MALRATLPPAAVALYHILSPRVPRSGVSGGGAVPI